MDIITIIICFVLGLFLANQHSRLAALVDIINDLQTDLSAQKTRLDAQNAAIRELMNWNTDQDKSIHNILDTILGINQEAQNIATNLIKTDNRVTEIERYYVTYVARKKVEDDGNQIQEKPVSHE